MTRREAGVERRAAVERLADLVALVRRPHPVRVAIDGADAAGKTTLADELVKPLEARGRTAILLREICGQ